MKRKETKSTTIKVVKLASIYCAGALAILFVCNINNLEIDQWIKALIFVLTGTISMLVGRAILKGNWEGT